jgi:hypothetical protein
MPEGLQEAAVAFQTEIAPASSRPRDDSGRFASTSRPETMFEPRPVEGDPLTGDTRDGGDDARLAAAERRVADGRAQEGDAERLSKSVQDGARARSTRGDDGHQPATDEPERLGPEDEQGENADGEDGGPKPEGEEGDAEGNAEQDAGPKYEVTVDGQTVEVSLPEALKGYIREQTFHQRMAKVAEARQAVEHEAASTVALRDAYAQKLQYFERVLGELTPPPPDWEREFAADPRAAFEKQKAYATIYGKIQAVQGELANEANVRAQEYDRNAQTYAVNQFSQFVAEANIRDEKALSAEMSQMRSYGKLRGFAEGELATVYDKRMLLVLRDAARYHQATANKPKPVIPGKGKTLAPGVATPIGNATRRSLDEAMSKLAKTGRTDDAAQVFQRLIR